MMIPPVAVYYRITPASLTASQFQTLTEVLPEIEPFANLTEPNTRQAYHQDIQGFMAFEGLRTPKHFHDATRAHVLVSRNHLVRQEPANTLKGRRDRAILATLLYHVLR
jgi:hypothetical protein